MYLHVKGNPNLILLKCYSLRFCVRKLELKTLIKMPGNNRQLQKPQ